MEEPEPSRSGSGSGSELRMHQSLKGGMPSREPSKRGRSPPRERPLRAVAGDPLTHVVSQAHPINGGSSEASMKSVISGNMKQGNIKPQEPKPKEVMSPSPSQGVDCDAVNSPPSKSVDSSNRVDPKIELLEKKVVI